MPPKIGKNEEARARSRATLLKAGADLMVENVLENPFASLTLRSICKRADYSTGAFYLHWANIDEYYTDLAKKLVAEESFDDDMADIAEVGEHSADASTLTAITPRRGSRYRTPAGRPALRRHGVAGRDVGKDAAQETVR